MVDITVHHYNNLFLFLKEKDSQGKEILFWCLKVEK